MLRTIRLTLLVLVLTALSLSAAAQRPAAAQPSPLTLAELAPSGTMFYASIRADAGFIETFDGLITRITEISGFPVNSAIGSLLSSEEIRPWMGDSVALFILPPASNRSRIDDLIGLTAEITDRETLIAYLKELTGDSPIQLPNGFVAFNQDGLNIIVTENRLIMAGRIAVNAIPLLHGATLRDSPRFAAALDTLPDAASYPALVYFDPRSLISANASEIFEGIEPVDIPAFAEAVGVLAGGIVQLDGDTYAIDVAWRKGEGSIFDALYLTDPNLPMPPALNPDFINVIPVDAQIVIHGAGLWSQFEASNRATGMLTAPLRNRLINAGVWDVSVSNPLTWFNSQWASAFTELSVRGSLGLTDEQLRAALDGDSALAVRLSPAPSRTGANERFLIETGVWFASRDGASKLLLAGGTSLLESFDIALTKQSDSIGLQVGDALNSMSEGTGFQFAPDWTWLATDTLTYIGADALTLENKQTLIAVPRVTERIALIRPYLLDDATLFVWADVTGLVPYLQSGFSDPTLQNLLDGLFISARQTDSSFTARFAFRFK